jgi:CubicO group peptidase (beta-lactamase class C family)
MSHFHRMNVRAQHIRSALFSLVFLVSLLLPTLLTAPVQAMHATPPPPSATGLSDPRELGTFLDRLLSAQLRDDHIPGATVSVVKDGRLFFAKGYGSADLQAGTPVSAQTTLFRIGSLSKLFTATAVMQLAEQGKLNLHADVNTYLKTFHIPATYPEPITLAHLLTHTAGFEDRETGLYPRTISDLEPLGQWLAEHIPARVRPPGELSAYSNYGFALAGYIVEQVSGLPYAQYVEQHLFQPLGMRESTSVNPSRRTSRLIFPRGTPTATVCIPPVLSMWFKVFRLAR